MFTYPLRPAILGWLVGLALAAAGIQYLTAMLEVRWLPRFEMTPDSGVIVFGVVGILLEVYWWLLAFKIAVEGLRAAASGRRLARVRELWIEDEQAARQVLLWGGLLFAAYLLYLRLGGFALSAYCLLLALSLPAILVLLAMDGSLRRAFDVRAWLALMRRSGADYLIVVGKLALLAVLFGIAQVEFFAQQPRWLAVLLARLAVLYVLVAGYHELGRMLDRHRREMQLPQDKELARPEVSSPEEAMAMRAAERYAAEYRFARGARELEPLVVAARASSMAHARFRELLASAGDHATLLMHARHYIPMLLAADKEGEALALYRESLSFDPAFELGAAGTLGRMAALLLREQQPQLAIATAQEYLRCFPDDPDTVTHGLAAARLMDRMGRDEDARMLLVEMVRRFPQHPMRGELIAALETLEGAARRER